MVLFNYSINQKGLVKVGDKIVGHLEENRFIKSVVGSKHQLRHPPAWAIDAEVFDHQIKPNATEIIIEDKESGVEYQASVEIFVKHCFRFNRGFGTQYALPIQLWHVEKNGHKQLMLWEDAENTPTISYGRSTRMQNKVGVISEQ